MGKKKSPTQQNKNLPQQSKEEKVAKITSRGAIIVAWIGAFAVIAAPIISFFIGKQQGEKTAVVQPTPCPPDQAIPPGQKDNDLVIMIGSGTVYRYLNRHKIFEGLGQKKGLNVLSMEGPTDAGVQLFTSAYKENTILLMASRRINPDELSRAGPVLEVFLGADQLQMVLIAGSDENKTPPLEMYFGDILNDCCLPNKDGKLDFESLVGREQWWGGHLVYVGGEQGATRSLWRGYITNLKKEGTWPPDENLRYWDIISPEDVNNSTEPRIYLGSQVLSETTFNSLYAHIYKKKS